MQVPSTRLYVLESSASSGDKGCVSPGQIPKVRGNCVRKTLCLLFMLFLLMASRKSTNSGKYHLLEKRNPFYFLAYFFLLFSYFLYFQLTFYINFTYTLLFFLLLHVLYQSTFFMNLASKKEVEGITFSTFLQKSMKKYEK